MTRQGPPTPGRHRRRPGRVPGPPGAEARLPRGPVAAKAEPGAAGVREAREALLTLLAGTQRGAAASADRAAAVDAQVDVLQGLGAECRPWAAGGEGEADGQWVVLWSTEEDTRAFLRLPLVEPQIFQTVDTAAMRISNHIVLAPGTSLRADAPLEIVSESRIRYFFESLHISVFGLALPKVPVRGRVGGWSDTVVYTESGESSTLRILRNFRKDLIILERREAALA